MYLFFFGSLKIRCFIFVFHPFLCHSSGRKSWLHLLTGLCFWDDRGEYRGKGKKKAAVLDWFSRLILRRFSTYIVNQVLYDKLLADVDYIHGTAEALLSVSCIFLLKIRIGL